MAVSKRESRSILQSPQKQTKRTQHQHLSGGNDLSSDRNLPDDLLEKIFSFLPIKLAVQIGVLSRRFKKSWLLNRKLFFDREFARRHGRDEFLQIVNRVLSSHTGPKIECFRLCFAPTGVELMVEKWIKICTEKGVEELGLDFYQGGGPHKLSPQCIDVESVKILKLSNCEVDLPPKLKAFSFLGILELLKVDITTEMIETLFSHCSLLETLDLWQCYRITHLNIFARNLRRFKVLKLGYCSDIISIHIQAPTLRTIFYTGDVVSFRFSEVFQLDDVLFNFLPSKSFSPVQIIENMVTDLSHVNVLTTTTPLMEGLTTRIRGRDFADMQFCFWNLKEFHLFMEATSFCNLFDIASFLKNCPRLEKLFLDLNEFSFEYGFYWKSHQKEKFENFQHFFPSLKFITVKGFKFELRELQIVSFFLRKATSLEGLVLVTPTNGRIKLSASEVVVFNQLFCSWKASPKARVVICEHTNDSTLVQPKHTKFWS